MAINPNEKLTNRHKLYLGKSGSGKTYAIQNHNKDVKKKNARVLVWDAYQTQDCFYFDNIASFAKAVSKAIKSKGGFRIGLAVDTTPEAFEIFCKIAWAAADGKKELVVLVEELSDVARVGKASPAWGKLVRVGRKFGIILLPVSQRPTEIDKTVFTQVSGIWVGLLSPYEHKFISQNVGISVEKMQAIKPESYEHYYADGHTIRHGTKAKPVRV